MFIGKLKLLYHGQGDWELLDSFCYKRPNGDIIHAPKGMETDLASIPEGFIIGAIARAAIRKLGKHVRSAVIHDSLYSAVADVYDKNGEDITGLYTRKDCDNVLHEAMVDEHEGRFKRFIITKAVNWFGSKHFKHDEDDAESILAP